jgi:hypothetical protein
MTEMVGKIAAALGEETWKGIGAPTVGQFVQKLAEDKKSMHASCWHAASEESILMWNRYAHGGESIAIQTTAGDLLAALTGVEKVRMGVVSYDPSEMVRTYGTASECFYKYPIFAGEKEVRLVTYSDRAPEVGRGVYVDVDLPRLVKKVFVSPDAEDWFVDLVKGVLSSASLAVDLHRTELRGP